MKLLFDHNLSPRLVNRLQDIFPNSVHIYPLGLDQVEDSIVWDYAYSNDFCIVTKDIDFNEMSIMRGFPPKIIWIRRGNCATLEIENLLRNCYLDIQDFMRDTTLGILTLY